MDTLQEFSYLIKLCDERYFKYKSPLMGKQMTSIKDERLRVAEGATCIWLKNCIGYLLKNPTAQFIDPQYMPLSYNPSYEEMKTTSAITQSVIQQQYSGFPMPTPQQTNQLKDELSIIQQNYKSQDLSGQPVMYRPSPEYTLTGDPLPPPPAQKGAMDWLGQGLDLAGNIASIGMKLFDKFS